MDKNNVFIELQSNFKRAHIETDLANLHVNSCLRKKIFDYHSSDIDKIRKAYLQKRLCQPINRGFIQTQFRKIWRHVVE
jgi:hypothetical protein